MAFSCGGKFVIRKKCKFEWKVNEMSSTHTILACRPSPSGLHFLQMTTPPPPRQNSGLHSTSSQTIIMNKSRLSNVLQRKPCIFVKCNFACMENKIKGQTGLLQRTSH